jgi:hypothetical protein
MENKYSKALSRIKSWIEHDGDYGKLCQFTWRHNRAYPAFFDYPVFRTHTSTLNLSVDEVILNDKAEECYGISPSDKYLNDMNIYISDHFDIVAVHKGLPRYCFQLTDATNPSWDYETLNFYKMMTKDNDNLEIHYLNIDDILELNQKPETLHTFHML